MKHLNLVEFCGLLKESPYFISIHMILFTCSPSPEIRLRAVESGADDYVTTPF